MKVDTSPVLVSVGVFRCITSFSIYVVVFILKRHDVELGDFKKKLNKYIYLNSATLKKGQSWILGIYL